MITGIAFAAVSVLYGGAYAAHLIIRKRPVGAVGMLLLCAAVAAIWTLCFCVK